MMDSIGRKLFTLENSVSSEFATHHLICPLEGSDVCCWSCVAPWFNNPLQTRTHATFLSPLSPRSTTDARTYQSLRRRRDDGPRRPSTRVRCPAGSRRPSVAARSHPDDPLFQAAEPTLDLHQLLRHLGPLLTRILSPVSWALLPRAFLPRCAPCGGALSDRSTLALRIYTGKYRQLQPDSTLCAAQASMIMAILPTCVASVQPNTFLSVKLTPLLG